MRKTSRFLGVIDDIEAKVLLPKLATLYTTRDNNVTTVTRNNK